MYSIQQRSKFSFLVITILLLLWLIAASIYSTWFSDAYSGSDQVVNQIYGILCLALTGIALILSVVVSMSLFNFKNRLIYSYLQAIYLLSITLVFLLKGIQFLHVPPPRCDGLANSLFPPTPHQVTQRLLQSESTSQGCPSDNSFSSLCSYQAVLIMLSIFQMLTPILFEPRVFLLVICDASTGTLMLYTYYNSIYTLVPFLTTFLSIILVIIQLHLQSSS